MNHATTYAGIGARATPTDILAQMERAAMALAHLGWTLRSGAADGADTAFETGCSMGSKEIYLPWGGFNGRSIHEPGVRDRDMRSYAEAESIAADHHPAWPQLSSVVKTIMTRNSYQVLGPDLRTPSKFILCWTPGGRGSGGTGQALRIASNFNIPIFDLGSMSLEDCEQAIIDIVNREQEITT